MIHRAEATYFEINRYSYIKQIICEEIQFWLKFKYRLFNKN